MSTRAEHYVEAERLVVHAMSRLNVVVDGPVRDVHRADALLYLRAADVHAQLACAGPGVEQEVNDLLKRVAPTQTERQAARRPLPIHLIAEQSAHAARPKPGPPSHTAGKERS